jgi:hypothetical protein
VDHFADACGEPYIAVACSLTVTYCYHLNTRNHAFVIGWLSRVVILCIATGGIGLIFTGALEIGHATQTSSSLTKQSTPRRGFMENCITGSMSYTAYPTSISSSSCISYRCLIQSSAYGGVYLITPASRLVTTFRFSPDSITDESPPQHTP